MATQVELEQLLGKAFLDDQFRDGMLKDPTTAAAGCGITLTPDQIRQLLLLERTGVKQVVTDWRRLIAGTPVFPKIDRHPGEMHWGTRGCLCSMPTYDPNSSDPFQVDLRSYDLSGLDLRHSLNDLIHAVFDDQTKWPPPDKMPPEFDWKRTIELAKNPGLGLRNLHSQGITGSGVGIGVIDGPMLVDHCEYADRIQLYEEINIPPYASSVMHGVGVTSLAGGKMTGVAPEADIYYIGCPMGDYDPVSGEFKWNFRYMTQGIRRLMEINYHGSRRPKIPVISISNGWLPDQEGYDEATAAVQEAKDQGILVVSSNLEESFGFKFNGLGRSPLADPDDFASYGPGMFWAERFYAGHQSSDVLLVPMDSRAAASPCGAGQFAFFRQGGLSWAIPYIAGMYALAIQKRGRFLNPARFWAGALRTGRTMPVEHNGNTYSLGPILDPAALMADLDNP